MMLQGTWVVYMVINLYLAEGHVILLRPLSVHPNKQLCELYEDVLEQEQKMPMTCMEAPRDA